MTKQTKKTATTKVTETIKKPTVKSLQDQITNHTSQLVYANQKALLAEEKITELKDELTQINETPWAVITYSRFVGWLYRITHNFKG